jgi:hypothetical protein
MENNYYTQVLYPFQDRVLQIIGNLPIDFYLTGNTALCRGYLNHRYSAELNFSINADNNYQKQVDKIFDGLNSNNLILELNYETPFLKQIIVKENDIFLQVEFHNEVLYRIGIPTVNLLFKSIDNLDNILSNKILQMEKFDDKDVIDIIYIALNYNFNWDEIFKSSEQKNIWIDNIVISNSLANCSLENLDNIEWTNSMPDLSKLLNYLKIICNDIYELKPNSLYLNSL